MPVRDPIVEFQTFNRLRAAQPRAAAAQGGTDGASPFAFFRGTFHLSPRHPRPVLRGRAAPSGAEPNDLVGDIHGGKLRTYGDDGRVHYDINDFDERPRAASDFDVAPPGRPAASCRPRTRRQPQRRGAGRAGLLRYSETMCHFLKKAGAGPGRVQRGAVGLRRHRPALREAGPPSGGRSSGA